MPFFIPKLWEKDWDSFIEQTDEEITVIPEAQKRIAHLFKGIDDDSFTFTRAIRFLGGNCQRYHLNC